MQARSILGSVKLSTFQRMCEEVREVPGDMAELGVYQGGAGLLMSQLLPEKNIHLFDTFKGLPEHTKDTDVHKTGEFADTSFEAVFEAYKDRKASFFVGVFPGTTGLVKDCRYCLVHLDADQYQSTLAGLEFFWPRLEPGGALVLDDYDWPKCPGVKRAIDEYFAPDRGKAELSTYCAYQAVVRKLR